MNDLPECSYEKNRTARKNHKCTSCMADILKGDNYTYISGIWSGEPESFKLCANCKNVVDNFKKMDEHLGYEDGPSLDLGGVGAWLQGFMCRSWHGEEAAKDIADLFGLQCSYVRRVIGLDIGESK